MIHKATKTQKILLGLIVVLAFLPIIIRNNTFHHVAVMTLLFATAGQAWNILTGFTGQTSFGHTAFFGIGAYTSSVLFLRYGISPWIGMLLGGIIAVVVAAVVSYPCFKLRGHYFAIATLAVAEIMQRLFLNWRYVERATGISLPVLDDSFWYFEFHTSKQPYYYITYFSHP